MGVPKADVTLLDASQTSQKGAAMALRVGSSLHYAEMEWARWTLRLEPGSQTRIEMLGWAGQAWSEFFPSKGTSWWPLGGKEVGGEVAEQEVAVPQHRTGIDLYVPMEI